MENNSLDTAYRELLDRSEKKDALQWYSQIDPDFNAQQQEKQRAKQFEPSYLERVMEYAPKVLSDIGGGIKEAPAQIAAGPGRATQGGINLTEELGSWIEQYIPLGGIQFTNEKGEFDLDYIPSEEFQKLDSKETGIDLPEVFPKPKTVTGAIVGGLAQFLTGYGAAGKGLSALGVNFGKSGSPIVSQLTRSQLQAAISDFAAFEGKEKNIADLVEMAPVLSNSVTQYLSTDKEDPELLQRLKNTLAGQVPDTIISSFIVGLRGLKKDLRAKALAGQGSPDDIKSANALEADVRAEQPGQVLRGADTSTIDQTLGKLDDDLVKVAKKKLDDGDAPRTDEQIVNPIADALRGEPQGGLKIDTGDADVYINISKFDSQEDVRSAIKMLADADEAGITKATRGVVSNKQTVADAGKVNAWELLTKERPGGLPNNAETYALRQLWEASGNKFVEIAELATKEPTPENLFMLRKMSAVHNAIQREVIGVRTETARALQQWSIPVGGNQERLLQIQSILDQHGGNEVTLAMAENIASLAKQPGGARAIDKIARQTPFATTMSGIRSMWINGILSSTGTHAVNMISNKAVLFNSIAERAIAARIDDLAGNIDGVRIGEATAMWWGVKQSWRKAFAAAAHTFRTGEMGAGRHKLELPRTRTISAEVFGSTNSPAFNALVNRPAMGKAIDMMGSLVELPGRFLAAEDEFFKTINYEAELAGQAFRMASDEAERGVIPQADLTKRIAEIVSEPSENMRIQAQDMAAYNTFTSEPGEITKTFMRMRNKVPGAAYIIPFINTPANIMKYTFERTPLAPLSAKYTADMAAGGARRSQAIAKLSLGTMAMAVTYDLALDGSFTGSGPRDHKKRAALKRTGWKPYSVRFNNGTDKNGNPQYRYVAYNRLDPLGTLVGIAADLAEWQLNTDNKADTDFMEILAAATFSAAENLKDKTYFRGLSDLLDAVNNPDRKAEQYLNRQLSSFLPYSALVNQARRAVDPHSKYTHDLLSTFKARVPGLSEDVPNRVDYWGREIKFKSGLDDIIGDTASAAYDNISPIYVSTSKSEPIDLELIRLKYSPSHARHVSIDGKAVPMRNQPHAHIAFSKYSGGTKASKMAYKAEILKSQMGLSNRQLSSSVIKRLHRIGDMTAMEYLNAVVSNKHADSLDYKFEDDDGKKKFIQKVMRDFHTVAKFRVISEFPELTEIRGRME